MQGTSSTINLLKCILTSLLHLRYEARGEETSILIYEDDFRS